MEVPLKVNLSQKVTRHENPISTPFFILAFDLVFMINSSQNIQQLNIFLFMTFFTLHMQITDFLCRFHMQIFYQNKDTVIELLNTLYKLSSLSELKLNKSKWQISGIGILKGAGLALCGLKFLNLESKTVRILVCHYLCYKKNRNNFQKSYNQNSKFVENLEKEVVNLRGKSF